MPDRPDGGGRDHFPECFPATVMGFRSGSPNRTTSSRCSAITPQSAIKFSWSASVARCPTIRACEVATISGVIYQGVESERHGTQPGTRSRLDPVVRIEATPSTKSGSLAMASPGLANGSNALRGARPDRATNSGGVWKEMNW